ncbi:nucleotidyltransferase family protein [Lentibacillus saliphilus]|uniref:nucleotidyltransferase family protein n=1 Tax=Lentibacillus saliphilus TaxID=2737028 RepID=UPI001C3002B3|nr:nucleotidyltransferase family protein [Lentibacillus saliphilus]
MNKWTQLLVKPSTSIIETMKIIDRTARQFAVVVDKENKLLGTITDGDIRRGILKGLALEATSQQIMNREPIYETEGKSLLFYKRILEQNNLKQLPVVNEKGQVNKIIFSDELDKVASKENVVVIMAGGLGTRLQPLTNNTPKPMLKIGDKPILETIISSFKSYGFTNFVLTVNYKKEQIKDYFQDGRFLGVNITYIDEEKRLGTAGALSLLESRPSQPFFVINGDLLTNINYEQLLEFHNSSESLATICVREHNYQIPYGVIEVDNDRLMSIKEKPIHQSFVNAGIYVLDPMTITHVPTDTFFDMPDLFNKLIKHNERVSAFPIREYWMDIGRVDDFEKANGEFSEVFK